MRCGCRNLLNFSAKRLKIEDFHWYFDTLEKGWIILWNSCSPQNHYFLSVFNTFTFLHTLTMSLRSFIMSKSSRSTRKRFKYMSKLPVSKLSGWMGAFNFEMKNYFSFSQIGRSSFFLWAKVDLELIWFSFSADSRMSFS